MMKLLIADDEPLVQIGLKSMLDWASLGIEICGTAANGEQAYSLIVRERPEIVISDIKMPLLSGLELAKKCRQEFGRLPVFIILTSYEDFQFAREALSFQAADYLIKLELTAETLQNAIRHAQQVVQECRKLEEPAEVLSTSDLALFQERFYIRLITGLFETPAQFHRQATEFQITFDASAYMAASIRLLGNESNPLTQKQKITLNRSTLQMFREMMSKYLPCQVISLDIQYFAVIFFVPEEHLSDICDYLRKALTQTLDMLYNYYTVTLFCSVGPMVKLPLEISGSYQDAKQFIPTTGDNSRILFTENQASLENHNVFSLSLFREDIREAFEESNEDALRDILDNIIDLLSQNRVQVAQAMDAASSILHLTINLMTNGSETAAEIFKDEADGYQSLYRLTSVPQIIVWLRKLEAGLRKALMDQKKKTGNYLVDNVKKYIASNIDQRLTLQNTALTFNISPNYLSQLFKKYTEIGFNEYVAQKKIEKAKELLKQGDLKVYEIADQLGFENAFYFSKVFKKFEGCSPRDYQNGK